VERSDVLALLITAAIAFISGYGAFELQEWLRRSRHAEMLKRALRAELERVDRVLGTYVYLWEQASEPTAAVIEEQRRLVGQSGLWGDEDPELARIAAQSPEDLAGIVRLIAAKEYNQVPRLTTPILDAVLASPPQGWDLDLLRRLSWLAWQVHLLNDASANMTYWLRATTTVADRHLSAATGNHALARSASASTPRWCSRRCATW
jgi:hypothetical protein